MILLEEPAITHIYNDSLMTAIFPSTWKLALITPIPKILSPTAPQHYKAIAILCHISKALEKLLVEQIVEYVERQNLFDPFQSAYRRSFSTQTALIRVMDDIKSAVGRKMIIISVFFDFSKAFDRVSYHLLLTKLKGMRFSTTVL